MAAIGVSKRAESASWQHFYKGAAWRRHREHPLALQPLCEFCVVTEDITAAEIADRKRKASMDTPST
jgi:hypothetical protein